MRPTQQHLHIAMEPAGDLPWPRDPIEIAGATITRYAGPHQACGICVRVLHERGGMASGPPPSPAGHRYAAPAKITLACYAHGGALLDRQRGATEELSDLAGEAVAWPATLPPAGTKWTTMAGAARGVESCAICVAAIAERAAPAGTPVAPAIYRGVTPGEILLICRRHGQALRDQAKAARDAVKRTRR